MPLGFLTHPCCGELSCERATLVGAGRAWQGGGTWTRAGSGWQARSRWRSCWTCPCCRRLAQQRAQEIQIAETDDTFEFIQARRRSFHLPPPARQSVHTLSRRIELLSSAVARVYLQDLA